MQQEKIKGRKKEERKESEKIALREGVSGLKP
jgi:hypothetical protein